MPEPRTTIGPYRLEREIGRGGMGIVYLGHDTRLDRPVAIKALPDHLVADAERLARFEREAKIVASLHHPGIAAVYALEHDASTKYLVMEYVEGETLAERLKRGPIPVDEALPLARAIAESLEAAHEKGIIHRDLKPGNVILRADGSPKVLDFGLARSDDHSSTSASGPALSQSPTVTHPIHSPTIPGAIMGTAGYMSPEQARGRAVDKRSDIFSFGCVVYEMLTGNRPFHGETVADALGATLHKETDLGLLPADTPRRVRDLLSTCLAKDRKNRLHDIADARIELDRAISDPRDGPTGALVSRPWWRSPGGIVVASLLAVAALSMAATALIRGPSHPNQASHATPLRANVSFPTGLALVNHTRAVAVSPDGTQVALVLGPQDGGTPGSLFLRDLSRLEVRPIDGTQGAMFPFWSPDGKSLGFFADRKLKRLDLRDGIVRVLCDAPAGRGGSWGTKGTIVFAPSAGGGLMVVSDSGGAPTPVTTTTTPGESHRLPQMMPDGERFLYYVQNTAADGVYAFDVATKQSRLLLQGWGEAFFVQPGTLIFARDENLLSQPFDPHTMELSGTPRPIAAGVYYSKIRGYINAGASARGTMVYQLVDPPKRYTLAWMDRKGGQTILPVEPQAIADLEARVSKDGRRAALSIVGDREEQSVAVLDLERGIRTRLSDSAVTFSFGLLWGPGDQSVITSEDRDDKRNLIRLPLAGGPGTAFFEAESGVEIAASSITPDGKTVLFVQQSLRDKLPDIFSVGIDGSGPATRFMQTPEAEWTALISPPADTVAYVVRGDDELDATLKVVPYPTATASIQVSPSPIAGDAFFWSGPTELTWVDLTRRVWNATITNKDGSLEVGLPQVMFDGTPLDKDVSILDYNIALERFLIAVEEESREDPQLIIVNDWRPEPDGDRSGTKE